MSMKSSIGTSLKFARVPQRTLAKGSLAPLANLQKDSNFLLNRKGLLWKYFSSFALWILQQVKQFEKKTIKSSL